MKILTLSALIISLSFSDMSITCDDHCATLHLLQVKRALCGLDLNDIKNIDSRLVGLHEEELRLCIKQSPADTETAPCLQAKTNILAFEMLRKCAILDWEQTKYDLLFSSKKAKLLLTSKKELLNQEFTQKIEALKPLQQAPLSEDVNSTTKENC